MSQQEPLVIPGEPRLSRRIREAANRDALGRAAVLSGQGDLAAAARFTAAALLCRGGDKPCGVCPDCRKVLRDVHPDVLTVTDPEHKNVSVEILRNVTADASVLPNEGRRKVYIFPDCSLLDGKAQNVLLKVVEDGPVHAAFLFCAANSAVLLPTIRSRAEEWRLPPAETAGEGAGAGARQLCELLCGGKRADIVGFFMDLESGKCKREELQILLAETKGLMVSGLAACYDGGDSFSQKLAREMGRRRLAQVVEVLETYIRRCGYNIGVGHLTGALAAELAERP